MKNGLENLFSSKIRFRELSRANHSICSQTCTSLWGNLPDGQTLSHLKDFLLTYNMVGETKRFDSSNIIAFLGVSYDFDQKMWINDFDETEFEKSLWAADRSRLNVL